MPSQSVSPSHQNTLGKNIEVSPKPPLLHFNAFIRQIVLGIIPCRFSSIPGSPIPFFFSHDVRLLNIYALIGLKKTEPHQICFGQEVQPEFPEYGSILCHTFPPTPEISFHLLSIQLRRTEANLGASLCPYIFSQRGHC